MQFLQNQDIFFGGIFLTNEHHVIQLLLAYKDMSVPFLRDTRLLQLGGNKR